MMMNKDRAIISMCEATLNLPLRRENMIAVMQLLFKKTM